MSPDDDDKDLLIETANFSKDMAHRREAAEIYRSTYGEDVPIASGPVLEGESRFGPGVDPPSAMAARAAGNKWDKRLEMLGDRMSNMVSLGLSRPAMDALGLSSPERRQQLEADPEASIPFEVMGEPVSATGLVGDTAGGLLGAVMGPVKMLDQAVRAGAGKVGQAVAPALQRLGPRVRGALDTAGKFITGAGSGVAANAAQNIGEHGGPLPSSTEDLVRLMDLARTGAGPAALVGGGGDLLAAFAKGGQGALRGKPGEETTIGRRAKAKERGAYDPPEVVTTSDGPVTFNKTREGSVANLRDSREAAELGAGRAAQADLDLTRDSHAQTEAEWAPLVADPVSRARIEKNLEAQQSKNINPRTGLPFNDRLARVLDRELMKLRGPEAAAPGSLLLGPDGQPAPAPPAAPPPDLTVGEVRRHRQEARKGSSKGAPSATEAQLDADVAYDVWREALREGVPQSRDIDARSTARAQAGRDRRDILFGTEKNVAQGETQTADPELPPVGPDDIGEMAAGDIAEGKALAADAPDVSGKSRPPGPRMRQGKRERAATVLDRVGETTDPAKAKRSALERLAAMDPEFKAALDLTQAMKDLEATRFSLKPGVRNSLGGTGEAGFWGPLLRHQGRFLGAKLDSGLGLGAKVSPKASRLVPLLRDPMDALLLRMKQEEE